LRAEGVVAVLNFGALQVADGRDRRAWAADLRSTIVELRGAVTLPG
jgi:1-acyl-sn-glycerol-3-phosphate acyltransferase